MIDIGRLILFIIQGISTLIVVWCLLSWFPNIRWYEQPFRTLDQIVQPIILPFRRLIPPISGIDLSPMVAILLLQFLASVAMNIFP